MRKHRGRSSTARGLTLLELLVASTVSAILALSVHTAFTHAHELWERTARRLPRVDHTQRILEAIRWELAGLYLPDARKVGPPFSTKILETGERSWSFFTTTPWPRRRGLAHRTVRVTYEFRRSTASAERPSLLVRREQLFAADKPLAEPTASVVAEDLSAFDWAFYDPAAELETERWKDNYVDNQRPPQAVRIRIGHTTPQTVIGDERTVADVVFPIICEGTLEPLDMDEKRD